MKDAAHGVSEDVTQDVEEDVLSAAEDRSVKVFIVERIIFHSPPRFPWATRKGRARQGSGAERCAGLCGERSTGRGAGIVQLTLR